jgi:hypothetical protein
MSVIPAIRAYVGTNISEEEHRILFGTPKAHYER